MPTTSRARSIGLSPDELIGLRTAIDAGRKPKVMFTAAAGQIAGQQGQVVRLEDPAADEWVVVRFGRDELPFAPGDLQIPPKAPRKKAPRPAAAVQQLPVPVPQPDPVHAAAALAAPAMARVTAAVSRPAEPPAAVPMEALPMETTVSTPAKPATAPSKAAPVAAPAPAPATAEPVEPGPAKRAAKRPPRRATELTVTLGYQDGRWSVQAGRGARTLVKPTSVRPADALKMVSMLESPGVTEVVAEIVSAAKAEAEQEADRLRQQLAEVEATLADLED
jgi:hypothetical protein